MWSLALSCCNVCMWWLAAMWRMTWSSLYVSALQHRRKIWSYLLFFWSHYHTPIDSPDGHNSWRIFHDVYATQTSAYRQSWDEIWRNEGNALFNDALNTFYLRLYGGRHMLKDHSDSGFPLSLNRCVYRRCVRAHWIRCCRCRYVRMGPT